eukprot:scaffold1534_cov267-Pinguiococcus_pyrenoidosus.AAC.25
MRRGRPAQPLHRKCSRCPASEAKPGYALGPCLLAGTAWCLSRSLVECTEGTPLIVNVSSFGGLSYTFNVAYGVCKAAVDRLAADCAKELKPLGISTLSLWPGVVATERMKQELQSMEKGTFGPMLCSLLCHADLHVSCRWQLLGEYRDGRHGRVPRDPALGWKSRRELGKRV